MNGMMRERSFKMQEVYPNDDPDTAAKKISLELKKDGLNVISKSKNKVNDYESKPKTYAAYKYSRDIPLAEEITLGTENKFLQIIDGKRDIL
jgi:hypothetical protein